MKLIFKVEMILLILSFPSYAQINSDGITVRKIWSNEYHNAFTSLLYFKNELYCSFRQGSAHVGGTDGVIRIIKSKDGAKWEPVALLEKDEYDLRDPKLSITPGGKIMVIMGGSEYEGRDILGRLTHVSFSDRSGRDFSRPQPITVVDNVKSHDDWLWRVTWHDKVGYGVLKQGATKSVALLKTSNGIDYELVRILDELSDNPNEATVRVMPDREMIMMIRQEGMDRKGANGLWGRSQPPYTEWKWKDAGIRFGGPDFIPLKDDLFIAGTRVYKDPRYTGLFLVSREGRFREIFRLTSGGDTSYPGFVVNKNTVYVSYYSSHEGKSSIYLAEIPMSEIIEK